MYRDIPNTITAIRKALREAKVKYDEVITLLGTPAFTADTYTRLNTFYPNFDTQIIEMDAAKGQQLSASLVEDEKMLRARIFCNGRKSNRTSGSWNGKRCYYMGR